MPTHLKSKGLQQSELIWLDPPPLRADRNEQSRIRLVALCQRKRDRGSSGREENVELIIVLKAIR